MFINNSLSTYRVLKLPIEYVYHNKIIPISEDIDYVEIGCINKISSNELQYLEFLFGKKVIQKPLPREEIEKRIHIYFGHELRYITDIDKDKTNGDNEEAQIVNLCDYIIIEAINKHASDIHIEPGREEFVLRFRINGSLVVYSIIHIKYFGSIIRRFKTLSGMNIAEKRIPQDGKLIYDYNGSEINIRISTLPTILGEKMALRLLYTDDKAMDLECLNFHPQQKLCIENMMKHSYGIILVTGPTGSGKSTTLYSIINRLNRDEINISTVEDPVEVNIKGINQINVNKKAGITFSVGLRSLLRQDPDIIMIGEIRDDETAKIAIRAAITGHLVLSTIHTNNAFSVVSRLQDMGVEEYLIKDSLIGCIAQRLIKKLCDNCKIKNNAGKYYEARGCQLCSYTGYRGRVLVSETIYLPEFYTSGELIDFKTLKERHRSKYGEMLRNSTFDLLDKGIIDYKESLLHIAEDLGEQYFD